MEEGRSKRAVAGVKKLNRRCYAFSHEKRKRLFFMLLFHHPFIPSSIEEGEFQYKSFLERRF
jgi:hypothetical protein